MSLAKALVLVISTRAAAGLFEDKTGPILVDWLRYSYNAECEQYIISDAQCGQVLSEYILSGLYNLIITTGGTGISRDDHTPEITRQLVDYEIPGIAESMRALGRQHTPLSALSRGIAGVKGATLIINIAGSVGAVKDAITALDPILPHALDLLQGKTNH